MSISRVAPHSPEGHVEAVGARAAIIGAPWRFLAEASGILDRSLDYQRTLTNVVRFVVPRLADAAVISLLAEDGSLSWGYGVHRDPGKESLVARLSPYWPYQTTRGLTAEALRGGETQAMYVVADDYLRSIAVDDTHLAIIRQLALRSIIVVPLAARGRKLGSLLLVTTGDSERRYTDRDVAIANEVGRRAALAVDHAVLFRDAEQAGRARAQMVAVVSHDLKNPLSTIQLAVSFLLEELVPDDAAHELERDQLHAIHHSADRMYRLIHDLLDVAAIEARRLIVARSPLAVDLLVTDALELLRPLAAAKHISLVTTLSPALPPVAADRERVLQVFSNLGGNALQFTPEYGRVELRATAHGAVVEFAVRDTGPGITSEQLPHVFDRFWQARKTSRVGVGLGLAIAKGIVEAHGGDISVENNPGGGTSFTFTLPVAAA